jgi:hypothetical protein
MDKQALEDDARIFVITADQVDSRNRSDLVARTIPGLEDRWGPAILLPPERTAGDELQLAVTTGTAVLGIALELTRDRAWSVGCGIGLVEQPLPESTRAATGTAFVAARDAVNSAKKRETRFALRGAGELAERAEDLEAVIILLLTTRARRSKEGWELFDLLGAGLTQTAAADRLSITPQAASKRARAGAIKTEFAATAAIGRMLSGLAQENGERQV